MMFNVDSLVTLGRRGHFGLFQKSLQSVRRTNR